MSQPRDVRTACLRDAIRDLQQCTYHGDAFDGRFRAVLQNLYEIRADLAMLESVDQRRSAKTTEEGG